MKRFDVQKSYFWSLPLPAKIFAGGIFSLVLPISIRMIILALDSLPINLQLLNNETTHIIQIFSILIPFTFFLISAFIAIVRTDSQRIGELLSRRLFTPFYGNPLNIKDGELIPYIQVECEYNNNLISKIFITIHTTNSEPRILAEISNTISSSLRGRYSSFAVTDIIEKRNMNDVLFICSDVMQSKQLKVSNYNTLVSNSDTKLILDKDTTINLKTSGSILLVGKTRSGKTQGAQSILGQIAAKGPDSYKSQLLIIDPKGAELSRLPHVLSPSNQEIEDIMEQIQKFEEIIKYRQNVLNDWSVKTGRAMFWWEIGMKPSILFIDEFVAFRTLLDTKVVKNHPTRSLKYFESLLKRIITMGASTGSYVMLSIAQANTQEISSMLRDAFTTKVLFKPTRFEAQFLWTSDQYELLPMESFRPGDAWLTSTDGIHDNLVTYLQFPHLNFDSYKKLGILLKEYYYPRSGQ